MKLFILTIFGLVGSFVFSQMETKEDVLAYLESLANANSPTEAKNVKACTFSINGCILRQTTHLKDGTSWDRDFNLEASDYEFKYYSTPEKLHDIRLDGKQFVLAFKSKTTAADFIEHLKLLNALCKDSEHEIPTLEKIGDFVINWNKARNLKNVSALKSMYAENIDYFGFKWTKRVVLIDIQTIFLKQTGDNTIKELYISYLNDSTALCKMDLIAQNAGIKDTMQRILVVQSTIEGLKIIRETDALSKRFSETENHEALSRKEDYYFEYAYWLDARNNDSYVYPFVSYNIAFDVFMYDSMEIGIELSSYLGGMRETIEYDTKDVQMKGGYLSFYASPISPEGSISQEYEFFRFKILSNEALIFAEHNGNFKDLLGVTFRRME